MTDQERITELEQQNRDLTVEVHQLRMFLRYEPEPGIGAWAWCCFCQESHPIDRGHVSAEENKARMDWRSYAIAKIKGLEQEIAKLAEGEFTDRTLDILVKINKQQGGAIARLRSLITILRREIGLWHDAARIGEIYHAPEYQE